MMLPWARSPGERPQSSELLHWLLHRLLGNRLRCPQARHHPLLGRVSSIRSGPTSLQRPWQLLLLAHVAGPLDPGRAL